MTIEPGLAGTVPDCHLMPRVFLKAIFVLELDLLSRIVPVFQKLINRFIRKNYENKQTSAEFKKLIMKEIE